MKVRCWMVSGLMLLGLTACASGAAPKPDAPAPPVAPAAEAAASVESPVPLGELFSVWQLLSLHEMAMGAQPLREASADPVGALLFLHTHEEIKPITRQRALEAMAFVPDDRVRDLYKKVIADLDSGALRHKAITGYARAWPEKAPEVLGGVLATDADVQIRLTAASALGRFCGDAGRKLVLQAMDTETEGWAKEKMQRYANPKVMPKVPPGLMPGAVPPKGSF